MQAVVPSHEAPARFTQQAVLELIESLYFTPVRAHEVSQTLARFQTRPEAWAVSVSILIRCAPARPSEDSLSILRAATPALPQQSGCHDPTSDAVVRPGMCSIAAFFAAQTVAALCQGGFDTVCRQLMASDSEASGVATFHRVRVSLMELIYIFRQEGSTPTVRQLTQAVCAAIVSSLAYLLPTSRGAPNMQMILSKPNSEGQPGSKADLQCRDLIEELLSRFGREPLLLPALLEILCELPHTPKSKLIPFTAQQRVLITRVILGRSVQIWAALAVLHDSISEGDVKVAGCRPEDTMRLSAEMTSETFTATATMRRLILQAIQAWLQARSRFNRSQIAAQSSIQLALGDEYSLIKDSSIVPILLLNFEGGIKQRLAEVSKSLSPGCLTNLVDDFNGNLQADFDCTVESNNAASIVLAAAGDGIIEVLDFLYSLVSALPARNGDDSPIINSDSFHTVVTILGSLCKIHRLLRSMTIATGRQRSSVVKGWQEETQEIALVDISLVPSDVCRALVVVMAKFAEIFLPAVIFGLHFKVFESVGQMESEGIPMPITATMMAEILEEYRHLLTTMAEFLTHPSLEFRYFVLEFWDGIVTNQFSQQQAQLESLAGNIDSLITQDLIRDGDLPDPLILPAMDKLATALIRVSTFPGSVTEKQMEFCFEAWLKFRDDVAVHFSDLTGILGCQSILERAGSVLLGLVEGNSPERLKHEWRTMEACLFVLSTVASRAPAGEDLFIPRALDLLPSMQRTDTDSVESMIMNCALARLVLWTSGYIGSQETLFASCFTLISQNIPALFSVKRALPPMRETVTTPHEINALIMHCEKIEVEALNTIVCAAAGPLARHAPEADITIVLNGLGSLVMISDLSIESRCSLIVSAGALLQCLPKDRMQKYHYQLGQGLHAKAVEVLQRDRPAVSSEAERHLRLFFVSMESVRPVEPVPVPPMSPNAIPLERASEYRHPVLNVIEEFWPLFDQCLVEFHSNEAVVEYVCHCVVRVFSQTQAHAVRYTMFAAFLDGLSKSFVLSPSVFHLGALRSILGIFGQNIEEPVQRALSCSLVTCLDAVLGAMSFAFPAEHLDTQKGKARAAEAVIDVRHPSNCVQSSGARQFLTQSPDIVGMTLDCCNAALNTPFLAASLFQTEAFQHCVRLCLLLTPECHHPKVLMTMLLLLLRCVGWLEPPKATDELAGAATSHYKKREQGWTTASATCVKAAITLAKEESLVEQTVECVVRTITEVFDANIQWIGIVGSLLLELLLSREWNTVAVAAIRSALLNRPSHVLSRSEVEDILPELTSCTGHADICSVLKKLAEMSEANWHKSQFSTQS